MIEIVLPSAATPGQVMACQATLVAAMGWQLGEFYDAAMQPKIGDDWLEQIRQARLLNPGHAPVYKKKLRLHDFSFCLTEPAKNSNSPLRTLLPKTTGFFNTLDRAIVLRNASLHGNAEYTLKELSDWVAVFGSIAIDVGLAMASECAEVQQRVNQLEAGVEVGPEPSGGLLEQMRAAEHKISAMAREATDLKARLGEQQEHGAVASEALASQLEAAEAAKAAAEENAGQLQSALENQLRRERSEAAQVEPDLEPGDTVAAPPVARTLLLLPFVRDLYDPSTNDLLSNQAGPAVNEAVTRWSEQLPNGGPVMVTDAGGAYALVGYEWTYLGTLDGVGP